jgi:hypothetical protein
MRSVGITLAVGAALVALALGLALRRSPVSVAGTNGIPDGGVVASTRRSATGCQAGETVPAGTSAIRLTLAAETGPSVAVAVKSGGRTVTDGSRGNGWIGASVTVPVRHVSNTTPNVEVCFALGRPLGEVAIFGEHTPGADALVGPRGERLPGRMGVEYLRPGGVSWLSLSPTIARRMGFGHAWGGTWIVFALLAAMASVAGLLAWMVRRELRLEEPR